MMMKPSHIIEGGAEAITKITSVLRKLSNSVDTDGELEIVLVQVAKMGELPINEFVYDKSGDLEDLVKEIVDEAETDAEQHRGKIKYAIRVKDKNVRTIFILHVPIIAEDDEDDDEFDELPNRRGLIQQQMRHTEVFAKEMIASTKTDRSFMYNLNRDLQQENMQLKKQWFEGQAIIEKLRNMQFARDIEIEKLRKQEQRKDQVAGMLLQAGPMIASKFMGGGAQAASQSPLEALGLRTPIELMVEGLFASLEQNPAKLQRIAEVLDPIELANLSGIHKYIAERREKEEEMKRSAGGIQDSYAQSGPVNTPPFQPYTVYASNAGANGVSPNQQGSQ